MLPEGAFGFHFGNEIWIDPPDVIWWFSVIEKVTVFIAPTTFEAGVIDAAIRIIKLNLPVKAPTVAVSVIPLDFISNWFPEEFVVSTINEEVVVVVGGLVNPFIFIWIKSALTALPKTAVITLPDPLQVTTIPLGST
jgi:hypothetical protein